MYVFDSAGRHLETLATDTLITRWAFAYDGDGLLTSATDVDGDTTTIERSTGGHPTAIVGPDGHRTTVAVDADGYLSRVENPAGEVTQLTHDPARLLQTFTNPRGHTTTFTYDADGFLVGHEDAVDAIAALDRTETAAGEWQVSFTSPEGRTTDYGSDI